MAHQHRAYCHGPIGELQCDGDPDVGASVLLTFRSASGQVWEGAAICGPLRDAASGREIALEDTALMDLKLTMVRVVPALAAPQSAARRSQYPRLRGSRSRVKPTKGPQWTRWRLTPDDRSRRARA